MRESNSGNKMRASGGGNRVFLSTAYIGIGANLGEPLAQAARAADLLAAIPNTRLVSVSSAYQTSPLDCARPQPDYINAAAAAATALAPADLLVRLLAIEQQCGRQRGDEKNAPRMLDLDLLAYGNCAIQNGDLQIPHPRLWRRAFALAPLVEIAGADFHIPGFGTAGALLAEARKTQRIFRLGALPISTAAHQATNAK
jgi:2-amino-4-hydroxy-6-hydroxymethyldihydropteridine diphosphokinase